MGLRPSCDSKAFAAGSLPPRSTKMRDHPMRCDRGGRPVKLIKRASPNVWTHVAARRDRSDVRVHDCRCLHIAGQCSLQRLVRLVVQLRAAGERGSAEQRQLGGTPARISDAAVGAGVSVGSLLTPMDASALLASSPRSLATRLWAAAMRAAFLSVPQRSSGPSLRPPRWAKRSEPPWRPRG